MRMLLRMLMATSLMLVGGLKIAAQATLVFEYQFNDSGLTTTGAGEFPLILEFQDQEGNAADWHSAAGQGVSGLPEDLSFDNTASTGMGSGNSGGRAIIDTVMLEYPVYDSLTLAGWFKTDSEPISSYARIFYWGNGSHQVYSRDSYLRLAVAGFNASSDPVYTEIGEWIFFAITYDGTLDTDNVQFFKGTRTTTPVLVSTRTLAIGPVDFPDYSFIIGNNQVGSTPTQPCDAWIDNCRMFAGSNVNGLLTLEELETLRQNDLANRSAATLKVELGVQCSGEDLELSWVSIPQAIYQVQKSTNLTAWQDLPSGQFTGNGNGQSLMVTISTDPNASHVFYRLLVTP